MIERIKDEDINEYCLVTLKELGNISEIVYQNKINHNCYIKKLSSDEYLNLQTGEIITCNHIKNRAENVKTLKLALKRLRDYINFNVTDISKTKWITLTYKENMTNTKKLYDDFGKFIKRFRYKFKNFKVEYIVAMEPQSRGAWHCHLLMIFNENPGFIDNSIIEKLWGHGFTKTQKLDNIDNIRSLFICLLIRFRFRRIT